MAVGKKQLTTATKKTNPVTTTAKSTTTPAVQKSVNNTPAAPVAKSTSVSNPAPAETRPYSSPNYTQSTSSTPAKTSTNTGSSKAASTPSTVKPSTTLAPVATTPAVTTPSTVAPTTNNVLTPQIGTSVNAAGTVGSLLQSQLEDILPTQPEPTLTNANQILMAQANEKPNETTDRYLNILNSVTGATGTASRPYSNPNYSFNTSRNNNASRRNNLDEIIEESVYNSLVGEPGSSAPFTEVPQYSLNNANLAINGPTTVAANQQATPTLSDLIAAQFANDYGTVGTNNPITAAVSGTTFDPYATSGGNYNSDFDSRMKGGNLNVDNSISNRSGGVGGNGGGGGIGGTPAYESAYDLDALYDLLNRQLAEYNNQYDSLMANLLSAYDMNNASLDDYYNQVLSALRGNYNDTESYLNGQLSNSQQALEDERRRALQEAYIARMMSEKQLADQLDAYGLSGGASESVLANLRNNYMNNRADVEEKTQASLKDLLQNYLGNVSNARQSYNQALMNAEQNRLNARQGYANNLAEAQANAANYLANARSGAYENLFNALAKQYLG